MKFEIKAPSKETLVKAAIGVGSAAAGVAGTLLSSKYGVTIFKKEK